MIVIVSGTNRPGSNTRRIADLVLAAYTELGVPARILDLRELPPSLYSPDAYAAKPPEFEPFAKAVLEAHGLVVVTPEYNGSFPGVLKVFIDHLKFPESFESKPVCFIGLAAGIWGALRSVEQLQQIFGYRNAHIFPSRVFMPGIGGLLDAAGALKDPELQGRLRRQAEGFAGFVGRVRGGTA
jgi:NAD(P)H-dependent FMN reductase